MQQLLAWDLLVSSYPPRTSWDLYFAACDGLRPSLTTPGCVGTNNYPPGMLELLDLGRVVTSSQPSGTGWFFQHFPALDGLGLVITRLG